MKTGNFYLSNVFRNTRSFENWGNLTRIIFSFSWGIFRNVMRLDQSRPSENNSMDYNVR